jgi:hypothetical protein
VFRRLDQRPLEIESVTSNTFVNVGRPWTVVTLIKEDATIAALVRWELVYKCNIARELQMTKQKFSNYLVDSQLDPCSYSRSVHHFQSDGPVLMQFY